MDRSIDNNAIMATFILESSDADSLTAGDVTALESSVPIPTFGPAVETSQVGTVRDGVFQPARAFSYQSPSQSNVGDIQYLEQLRRYGEVADEASVLSPSALASTPEPAPIESSVPVEDVTLADVSLPDAPLSEITPEQTLPTEVLVPPELRVPAEVSAFTEAVPTEAVPTESVPPETAPTEFLVPIESRVPTPISVPDVSAPAEAFASTEELSPPEIAPQILTGPRPLYFLSVSYHSSALLSDLLHTLDANQGGVTGVVVVNNSPTDRSVNTLCDQTYADAPVTVLDAPINMGFGAGCNVGLRWIYERSPHALVWIIHPDAKLLPNAVASIRQCCASRPDIAILGTPILDVHGDVMFGSGRFNRWTGTVESSQKTTSDLLRRPTPARWVSDYSMVLNLAALGHCPQFDEVYFLNYEDCDLCERYFQQGQVISMAPLPVVMHNSAGTSGRYTKPKFVYSTVGKLTFLRHHGSTMSLLLNVALVMAQVAFGFGDRAKAYGRWQGLKLFFKSPVTPPLYTPAFDFD